MLPVAFPAWLPRHGDRVLRSQKTLGSGRQNDERMCLGGAPDSAGLTAAWFSVTKLQRGAEPELRAARPQQEAPGTRTEVQEDAEGS